MAKLELQAWNHNLRLQTLLRHHRRLSVLVADPTADLVPAIERLQLRHEVDGAVQVRPCDYS